MSYPELSQVKKILVAKLRHHGDVLLSSPVYSILKSKMPNAEIDAYIYKETLPMLNGHPAISNFICYDKGWKKGSLWNRYSNEWKLLKQIRKKKYDLVINLTEGDRGAISAKVSKSPLCVGVDPEGGGMFRKANCYTHIVKHAPHPRHTVEKQIDALRTIGIFPTIDQRELVFHIPDSVQENVEKILKSEGITSGKFILVHSVSRWLFKCWPSKQFAKLIAQLHEQGYQIVMTSSPDPEELKIVDEILAEIPDVPVCNLGGKISLKDLGELIRVANLLVTVDSVPLHLASALKTPVVVLFGPTSEKTWGPWQHPESSVVTQNLTCRPCYRPGCGGSGKSDCLDTLSYDTVLTAVQERL